MQQQRTDARLIWADDPGSDRLSRENVIAIHKAHLAGESWDSIGRKHNTDRRYVARIVRGQRWPDLHPTMRPDLYADGEQPQPTETYTKEQIDNAFRAAYVEFIRTLAA